MNAGEVSFTEFLFSKRQHIIPIYQRKYSWTNTQCRQLWTDIARIAKDEVISAHFVGSIVYVNHGTQRIGDVPQSLVIDGQQRLTTLSLLLLAVIEVLKRPESEGKYNVGVDEIRTSYLVNGFSKDAEKRIKLSLTKEDKHTFDNLINNHDISEKAKNEQRVYQNFKFFVNQIDKDKMDIDLLFEGIQKLMIVEISLDKEDNPQLIFESLNSTGLDLSQSDLIRNYVLMGLSSEVQQDIYERYWNPMERLFLEGQNEDKFDPFMRAFLTIKMGSIPRFDAVYSTFKRYIYGKDVESVVAEVYGYAKLYARLDFNMDPDTGIREILKDIRTLRVDVAYPFLLEVYNDYELQKIDKNEFLEILKLIETHFFRRAISGIPTNSLNKTFANLYTELDLDNYLESFKAILILKSSYHRMPSDSEFLGEITTKDVYNFRHKGYLLEKLEHFENKERVDLEDLSIEHIMPQTLTSEWKESLGEDFKRIHAEYLNTLGNLTLTGYNSDMSNRSFQEKRDMEKGFKQGALRLSRMLRDLDEWNEITLKARAQELRELALVVWKYPTLDEEVLEKYREIIHPEKEANYSLEDYEYLEGEIFNLYDVLSKKIEDLSPDVKTDYLKLYIAFKLKTNFVDIVPQRNRLRLSLNMKYNEINDPKKITLDTTNKGRWGNGDIELGVSSLEDIEDAMFLIGQSFRHQA